MDNISTDDNLVNVVPKKNVDSLHRFEIIKALNLNCNKLFGKCDTYVKFLINDIKICRSKIVKDN